MQSGFYEHSALELKESEFVGPLEDMLNKCPYTGMCAQSEYGWDCPYDEPDECKLYMDNVEVEMKLWTYMETDRESL